MKHTKLQYIRKKMKSSLIIIVISTFFLPSLAKAATVYEVTASLSKRLSQSDLLLLDGASVNITYTIPSNTIPVVIQSTGAIGYRYDAIVDYAFTNRPGAPDVSLSSTALVLVTDADGQNDSILFGHAQFPNALEFGEGLEKTFSINSYLLNIDLSSIDSVEHTTLPIISNSNSVLTGLPQMQYSSARRPEGRQYRLDNYTITTAIPLPGSLSLILSGLMLVFLYRKSIAPINTG